MTIIEILLLFSLFFFFFLEINRDKSFTISMFPLFRAVFNGAAFKKLKKKISL